MAEEQAPANGVGLVTISLAWDDGKGDANAQIVIGGNWGSVPLTAQRRVWEALKFAQDKAQEAVIEAAVEGRTAARLMEERNGTGRNAT